MKGVTLPSHGASIAALVGGVGRHSPRSVPPLKGVGAGTGKLPSHARRAMMPAAAVARVVSRQLRIQLDWFNVFNTQRAIRQDETLRTNSGIPGAGFIQFPNPFYGQGTVFQYPSSFRLGIKFQF